MDSVVSQRALREIYLEPFRLAVKHANPKSFMTSYNRLNGKHCSESKDLLEGILRKEWEWKGLVMFVLLSLFSSNQSLTHRSQSRRSDWTGVYSTDESIKAGLVRRCISFYLLSSLLTDSSSPIQDVEMPGPPVFRGSTVNRVLQAGKLTMEDIDDRVRNVRPSPSRLQVDAFPSRTLC